MKKALIISVAIIVIVGAGFATIFNRNDVAITTQTTQVRNLPTVTESVETPVITKNPSSTPVVNDPTKTPEWFETNRSNINAVIDRIRSQKVILENTYDPEVKGKYVLDLENTTKQCEDLVEQFNLNVQDTSQEQIDKVVCQPTK